MLQHEIIERLRKACHADERVISALMFGSFATGEGDAYSDIEFAIFVSDSSFEDFRQRPWLDAISPVAAYFQDDFGHNTALFQNGVRGEFHFMRACDIPVVEGWKGYGWFPSLDAAVMLDRTGELSQYARALVGGPPARGGAPLVEGISLNLVNLTLFGANLLIRGEFARAWALLSKVHENLLKLVRLHEETTDHWPTPSRALETDISATAYARYLECTSSAEPGALCEAYCKTWTWSRELFKAVAEPLNIELPATVFQHIEKSLGEELTRQSKR